jgi:hypothetical protein
VSATHPSRGRPVILSDLQMATPAGPRTDLDIELVHRPTQDRPRYIAIEHGGDAPPTARLRRRHEDRTPP